MKKQTRRNFLNAAARGGIGLMVLPGIIPARLFGADAPSKKIHVAQIGCGRMGRSDMGNVLTEPLARVVAVCDLDSKRLAEGKKMVESFYSERGEANINVKTFHDYHDILASPDIDAVVITVPDHSHALLAIEAAIAGKHIYVQKTGHLFDCRGHRVAKNRRSQENYFADRFATTFATSLGKFSQGERICP